MIPTRSSGSLRWRQLACAAFLVGISCFAAVRSFGLSRQPANTNWSAVAGAGDSVLQLPTVPVDDAKIDLARGGTGPVYGYSVVPGGVGSPAALRFAVDADPVVRRHYASFNLAATRVVRLTQPRLAHVSYRIGDSIYWTKRQLLLRAGETMLTDGVHYARTRCGNQVAVAPGVTSPSEPAPDVFEAPIAPLRSTHGLPALPRQMPGLNPGQSGLIGARNGLAYLGTLAGHTSGLATMPDVPSGGGSIDAGISKQPASDPATVDGGPSSGATTFPLPPSGSTSAPGAPPIETTGSGGPGSVSGLPIVGESGSPTVIPLAWQPGGTDPGSAPAPLPLERPQGTSIPVDFPPAAVPEPATMLLMAAAGGWLRWKRRDG